MRKWYDIETANEWTAGNTAEKRLRMRQPYL
jgi:hypothetical protein